MKPGIVVIAIVGGEAGERIAALQKRFDPRLAAELPPHVTLAGSSGMGPIDVKTPLEQLRGALGPIAADTPPMTLRFERPHRFMQTNLVVLPLDPHGPIRALHERMKTSELRYEPPRFAFTPHCTLNFYRELPAPELRAVLAERVDEPFVLDRIAAYRTLSLTRTELMLELELTGSGAG